MGAARKLGVSYVYLWKILNGKCNNCESLVLKIDSMMPWLFDSACCKIDGRKIAKENRYRYRWDFDAQKFVLKSMFDRRCKEFCGGK